MKKILFFAAFLIAASVSVSAQSDAKKSCDKPCTHTEKASVDATETSNAAVVAAKKAENIEVKTCEESGNVSFYRKDVCDKSGKVSYTEVEYMESTGDFAVKAENVEAEGVTPAPETTVKKSSSKANKSGCCSSKSAKSSCSDSKATKASKAKSSCCSSKSPKKSCGTKS